MARENIPPVVLNRGAGTDTTAQMIAANAGDGMKVKYEEQDQLTLIVINASNAAITVTFKASTSRHAFMRGQGDQTETVAAGKTRKFAGLEQMRFKNDDGYMYVDLSDDTTVTIGAEITL